jgi:hypothetical protein
MPPRGLGLMLTSCPLVAYGAVIACLPIATSAAIRSGCRPKANLKAGEGGPSSPATRGEPQEA